jgi:hypothetical protein
MPGKWEIKVPVLQPGNGGEQLVEGAYLCPPLLERVNKTVCMKGRLQKKNFNPI